MKHRLSIMVVMCLALVFLAAAAFAVPQTINYQGYLESGGAPVNGEVSMVFRIYNAPSGGSSMWSEAQNVDVTDGAFSAMLGSSTPINLPFDMQYYLSIQVSPDPEMSPRVELTSVPYAMRAKEVDNAPAHVHSGSDITSGTVSATFLNTTVEVQRRVAESCAPNYSIRVVNVDGSVTCEPDNDTTYTAGTGVDIVGNQINVVTPLSLSAPSTLATIKGTGTLSGAGVEGVNTSTGSGVYGANTTYNNFGYIGTDYDGVVGTSNTAGGYGVHGTSNAGYGVYGQSTDGRAVYGYTNAGYAIYGNSGVSGYGLYTPDRAYVGGDLELEGGTTNKVKYNTPRTHYYTVGGEGFVPWNNSLDYENTGGFGGAFIITGDGYMVHAVDLPQGAQITNLKVYFDDTSASYDVSVSLKRMTLATGSYGNLGSVTSSGATGNQNGNIGISHTVDKLTNSYFLEAYCSNWQNASTVVMGAVITYTISEAP